jgi:hypothetical protein
MKLNGRLLTSALLLTGLVVAGCGGGVADAPTATAAGAPAPGTATTAGRTVAGEAGGVTVGATWQSAAEGVSIEVVLDTHAGSLDDVDLASATLVNDRGDTLNAPTWDAKAGGHHRKGLVRFGGDTTGLLDGARWVELRIPDVAGTGPRTLRWTSW